MASSRTLTVLMAATVVPTVALGAVGFWLLKQGAEGSRARYRERADGIAEAVEASVRERLAEVARGHGEAVAFRSSPEGEWLAPALSRPAGGMRSTAPRDPVAARLVRKEIDTFQARGETAVARARLLGVLDSSNDTWLCAWALTTLAILEEKQGHHDACQTAWQELLARYPGERDERGFLRSFVARSALARGAADERERLIELYADAVADTTSRDQLANRLFKSSLLARLGDPVAGSRLAEVRGRDRERERTLEALSTRTNGAADWVARGAEGSVAVFETLPDPLFDAATATWVFSVPAMDEPGVDETGCSGGLLELDRLLKEVLAVPALAAYQRSGYAIEFVDLDGTSLASVGALPKRSDENEVLVAGSLAAPFSSLLLRVHATDLEGFLASERRGALFLAGLIGLTLLGSSIAAFATFRAVRREILAAQARESFVAAVTHELKTPLASIRLLGEVLAHGGVEEDKVREFGARTAAEAERLSQLVTSVLELARLEHQATEQRTFELVDLNHIARGCTEVFSPIARERGFQLRLQQTSNDALVRGDERALSAALGNLLDNAFKYADDPHTVDVVVEHVEGMHRVAVLDRGRGVPDGDEELIFKPFQRVGDELTRDRPGVGLGLALVSRIAREHGGQAAYAAREGGGSRFAMELPAAEG